MHDVGSNNNDAFRIKRQQSVNIHIDSKPVPHHSESAKGGKLIGVSKDSGIIIFSIYDINLPNNILS